MTASNVVPTTGPESTVRTRHSDPSLSGMTTETAAPTTTTEPGAQVAPRARDWNEAIRDLDYEIRLNQRHCRLYNRLHAGTRFFELLGGSAAIGVAFSGNPELLKAAGAILAVVACANFAFDPGSKARDHKRALLDFNEIRAEAGKLTFDQIDKRRRRVPEPDYIEGLRVPSWNDMMRSHGYNKSAKKLSLWQIFMAAIA